MIFQDAVPTGAPLVLNRFCRATRWRYPLSQKVSGVAQDATFKLHSKTRSPAGGAPWVQFTGSGNALTVFDTENQSGSLEDFMFRRYNPTQGRWISPDPAGLGAVDPSNPQSWNRYAYVLNNPLLATDPLGLFCVWDNGSYDSNDDLTTGNKSDCEDKNGGTWFNGSPSDWSPGAGDWSGAASGMFAGWAQAINPSVGAFGAPSGTPDAFAFGNSSPGQIRPLSTLECAATFAPSLARTANIQDNTFVGKVGQSLLGNTFSGIYDTYKAFTSANGTPAAFVSLVVNGLRQGLPGGGPLSQGVSGVVQDQTLKFAFQNLGAQRLGQATVNTAAAAVGDAKVGYDLLAFLYSGYKCIQ